jgi:hypothetical protein
MHADPPFQARTQLLHHGFGQRALTLSDYPHVGGC